MHDMYLIVGVDSIIRYAGSIVGCDQVWSLITCADSAVKWIDCQNGINSQLCGNAERLSEWVPLSNILIVQKLSGWGQLTDMLVTQ